MDIHLYIHLRSCIFLFSVVVAAAIAAFVVAITAIVDGAAFIDFLCKLDLELFKETWKNISKDFDFIFTIMAFPTLR